MTENAPSAEDYSDAIEEASTYTLPPSKGFIWTDAYIAGHKD